MLLRVPLTSDFRAALDGLPDDWTGARFVLRLANEQDAARAAALLGGINAARHRESVRFGVSRRGPHGPDGVARALARVDRERMAGELEVATTSSAGAAAPDSRAAGSLAAEWDAELAALPPDWSDVFAEVELASTDYVERAALLLSPLNPARHGQRSALRFRCAHSFGYGTAPEMVRRSLERLDEEGVSGAVRILRSLSDTKPWSTQGPVWYVGGKSV
jgi:hypothetical protein